MIRNKRDQLRKKNTNKNELCCSLFKLEQELTKHTLFKCKKAKKISKKCYGFGEYMNNLSKISIITLLTAQTRGEDL